MGVLLREELRPRKLLTEVVRYPRVSGGSEPHECLVHEVEAGDLGHAHEHLYVLQGREALVEAPDALKQVTSHDCHGHSADDVPVQHLIEDPASETRLRTQ